MFFRHSTSTHPNPVRLWRTYDDEDNPILAGVLDPESPLDDHTHGVLRCGRQHAMGCENHLGVGLERESPGGHESLDMTTHDTIVVHEVGESPGGRVGARGTWG